MTARTWRRWVAGALLAAGLALPVGLVSAQDQKAQVQPGQPVTITVTTQAPAPDVSIVLGPRTGHVTPCRSGCAHTGGGNIDVQQPSPDTLVATMAGVAVATGAPFTPAEASLTFELTQAFEVSFDKPSVKAAKLTLEGRVIGFLRSHKLGGAMELGGADVSGPAGTPVSITLPEHAVAGCESLAVNDKEGPCSAVIQAGKFCLHQRFLVRAFMPATALPCKAPSAEFAPDPALDPLWISPKEPFHGAAKKDLGFQVTIKVAPEEVPEPKKDGNGK
jgi:hypothetical protein